MSDDKIDPNKKAVAIQNVKRDAGQIFSQLDGWCKNRRPPTVGLCNQIQALIDGMRDIIPILAPNNSPPNRPILIAYSALSSEWSTSRNRINDWIPNESWKNCAIAAEKFKLSVANWK
jgi:hypothetical protein